jgi:tetratricopeptide (TPR) repeat protein
MRITLLVALFIVTNLVVTAQSAKIDSLSIQLRNETKDTNRVTLLWQIAQQYQSFKPDTSLLLAEQALLLARQIQFVEGESRSLAILAASQYLLGDYPSALSNYMLKLQIEEKRNSPRNFASALNNIGLMHILLGEYPKALSYLRRADSTIEVTGGMTKEELKYRITNNIGETFLRMKLPDSAHTYFNLTLAMAKKAGDNSSLGESLLSQANVYALKENDKEALNYYHEAIPFLRESLNNDFVCEATMGMAKIYERLHEYDSAGYYAKMSYDEAKKGGFLSREFDAAFFLSQHSKRINRYDSAFAYMELSVNLKDSVIGQQKIKDALIISTNEQLRQAELADQRRKDKEARNQQLQLLLIAIFIPVFFLLTLFISRIKINIVFLRFMGIISLLLVFEYLTLLLHPLVTKITHHKPVLELMIFVIIGACLVPLHHKLEHWLIGKLIKNRENRSGNIKKAATHPPK